MPILGLGFFSAEQVLQEGLPPALDMLTVAGASSSTAAPDDASSHAAVPYPYLVDDVPEGHGMPSPEVWQRLFCVTPNVCREALDLHRRVTSNGCGLLH